MRLPFVVNHGHHRAPACVSLTTDPSRDGLAVAKCLLANCQIPLAKCITNPTCLGNLLCIQTCTNRPDEVGDFTKCAVTDKKCVPQRPDDGTWPVPKDEA